MDEIYPAEGPGTAREIYPGERFPELPFFDDDWFRFYHQLGDRNAVVAYEAHEMCSGAACSFRAERCKWHPPDCDCSNGMCQEYDDPQPAITWQIPTMWG
jgi:hypothetical protein